jgi:ribose 5-phosphate isomerase A
MISLDEQKKQAALAALALVEPHMRLGLVRLGLGTGSTAAHFVAALGEKVRLGLEVLCVPTSEATRLQAASLDIPLTTLDALPELDFTIDGADEMDADLRLIKGGGGALLREKIVASASRTMVVIADQSKRVDILGAFPLPIEIVTFGSEATRRAIARILEGMNLPDTLKLRLKANGTPFITDEGHLILDAALQRIDKPEALAEALMSVPGVVEHGLFLGLATEAFIATPKGVEHIKLKKRGAQ